LAGGHGASSSALGVMTQLVGPLSLLAWTPNEAAMHPDPYSDRTSPASPLIAPDRGYRAMAEFGVRAVTSPDNSWARFAPEIVLRVMGQSGQVNDPRLRSQGRGQIASESGQAMMSRRLLNRRKRGCPGLRRGPDRARVRSRGMRHFRRAPVVVRALPLIRARQIGRAIAIGAIACAHDIAVRGLRRLGRAALPHGAEP
jgi:hypothetical protein